MFRINFPGQIKSVIECPFYLTHYYNRMKHSLKRTPCSDQWQFYHLLPEPASGGMYLLNYDSALTKTKSFSCGIPFFSLSRKVSCSECIASSLVEALENNMYI